MDELTGVDYVTLPLGELLRRSAFSHKAFKAINQICSMTTRELENLKDHLDESYFDKESSND